MRCGQVFTVQICLYLMSKKQSIIHNNNADMVQYKKSVWRQLAKYDDDKSFCLRKKRSLLEDNKQKG